MAFIKMLLSAVVLAMDMGRSFAARAVVVVLYILQDHHLKGSIARKQSDVIAQDLILLQMVKYGNAHIVDTVVIKRVTINDSLNVTGDRFLVFLTSIVNEKQGIYL